MAFKGQGSAVAGLLIFIAFLLLPSNAGAYGDTRDAAETRENGNHEECWKEGDSWAWYKVECHEGNTLSVFITFDCPQGGHVRLLDPGALEAAMDESTMPTTSYYVSAGVNESGFHYIELFRTDDSKETCITLIITGAHVPYFPVPQIPGYPLVFFLIVGIATISLLARRASRPRVDAGIDQ